MRRKHILLQSAFVSGLLSATLAGQPLTHLGPLERRPLSGIEAPRAMPASFRLGVPPAVPYRLGAVRQSEMDAVVRRPQLPLVGIERSFDGAPQANGEWLALDDGRAVWRMAIQSDGASGVRVHFHNFAVASGSVWVYSEDHSQVFGPYTGSGIDATGDFWSHTIFADTVVVEYLADEELEAVPFSITRIAHLMASEQTMSAATCELDVTCYSPWGAIASGVGMYTFESGGAAYECSGALVNNSNNDSKPYFLTANHCISTEAMAQTVEVFWNFQTSTCNGTRPSLSSLPATLGATYLASAPISSGDFSLILLSQLPSISLRFYGWNASATALAMGGSVAGIHHPEEDYTRIVFGERDADATVQVGTDTAPASMFYQIQATAGVIEPGSSGSPLFTPDESIVGTLTYGPAGNACSINPFVAGYGRFAVAYPTLKQYLSPAAAVVAVVPSPASLSVNWTIGTAPPAAQTIQLSTASAAAVPLTVKASQSWIELSASSLSASLSKPASLPVILNSQSFTAAGLYSGTITLTGTGVSVSIPVQVNVAAAAPLVTVTPSPASLSASWTIGSSAPPVQSIQLSTKSAAAFSLTAKANQSWIELSAASLSASLSKPASLSVAVSTVSFTVAGSYSGTITLTATGVTVAIPVVVTVSAAPTVVTGGQTTLIPLIEDGAGAATSFTLLNPYPSATVASLSFFSGAGAPISIATGTAAATSWQNLTIPAYGAATIATTGGSSPQKQGFALIQTGDATKHILAVAQVGLDLVSPSLVLTPPFVVPFDATSTSTTTLYIYNPAAAGSVTLGLTIYNSSGSMLGTGQIVVPARQEGTVAMSKSLAVFAGQKGTLYVTGSSPVWSMGIRVDGSGRMDMVPPAANH